MRFRQHVSGESRSPVERIGKAISEAFHGFLRRINRNCGAACRTEPPQIIEAHDVIRMRMRVNHRIQTCYLLAEGLKPELGPSVDDPGLVRGLDINGRT